MRPPALNLLLRSATDDSTPDGVLLAEYASRRDPVAFERLVHRHAGRGWGVCRRVAADPHDAEDAFQATFLVLVRSAGSVSGSLSAWLYGVAFRVAMKARAAAARRRKRETKSERPEAVPPDHPDDTAAAVHTELAALPDRYRLPILLCDLEGLTRTDAATRLGWKEGTLSGRLNRGRKWLAERLTARGVTLAGGALAGTLTPPAAAVETVLGWARTESPVATASVVTLTNGVTRTMTLKLIARITMVSAAVLSALGVGLFGLLPEPKSTAAPVPKIETVTQDDITVERLEILDSRRVQREIKLTAEQRAKLLDGLDALLDERVAEFDADTRAPNFAAPPRPQRNYDEEQKAFEAKKRAFAATVVTPKQLARLREVEVQLAGEFAPLDPRVAEALKLTDKQKEKLLEVLRSNEDFRPKAQAPNPNEIPFEYKTPRQMRELVEKELTAAQRAAWVELAGDKMAFDPIQNQSDFRVRSRF
ncbi:MAG: RNA polymerase sigma factor, partial [Gemmataceae bacterium]